MKKILSGVVLFYIIGGILMVVGTFNLGLTVFAIIMMAAGTILLTWGIYKWQKKKTAEIIAEGIKKSKEEENKSNEEK